MPLQNNDSPLIYALPKGVNFWRIDWFGELAFPNRLMRRTQPSLLLHLSRVLDEKFQDAPLSSLAADCHQCAAICVAAVRRIIMGATRLSSSAHNACCGLIKLKPMHNTADVNRSSKEI